MRLSINSYTKKIISVLSCAVLSALFIVLMFCCPPKIAEVVETAGEIEYSFSQQLPDETYINRDLTAVIGKDITAVRISDLGELNRITKVNYVADKFVSPNELTPEIQIVDLTEPFEFAEKGTLIFIVMNLDPWSENFLEEKDALSKYKLGDYWHFTFSLPKIFCASNIYQQATLIARNGEIEDYDFINFTTSYNKKTEKFSAQTGKTVFSLKFYTRRETMEKPLSSAQIITVHYQSSAGAYSGITEAPLIGTDSAIKSISQNSQNLLIAFTILSAIVFAILAVLSVLEQSKEFLSAITCMSGIFVLLLSRFFLSGTTIVPLLWTALWLASSFIILCGALIPAGRNFKKIPAKKRGRLLRRPLSLCFSLSFI